MPNTAQMTIAQSTPQPRQNRKDAVTNTDMADTGNDHGRVARRYFLNIITVSLKDGLLVISNAYLIPSFLRISFGTADL